MLADRESHYEWERDGEPVVDAIMNAADMPEEAAGDIQRLLEDEYSDWDSAQMGEETAYADDSYYEERATTDGRWQEEWEGFELSVKTEARFFSRTAERVLQSVFGNLEDLPTLDSRPLLVTAGPGTTVSTFYRARAFQSYDRLEEAIARPDLHMGPPPSLLANAGRMNARGIAVSNRRSNARPAITQETASFIAFRSRQGIT